MITKSKITKLVSGFAGFAVALGFVVAPAIASAQSATDLQSQINSLLATIQSLQSQLAATSGSTAMMTSFTFNTNLKVGSKGVDVMNLHVLYLSTVLLYNCLVKKTCWCEKTVCHFTYLKFRIVKCNYTTSKYFSFYKF